MQKIILMGNLGRDPQIVPMKSGGNMLSFSLAVNKRKSGGAENTTWYRVNSTNYSDRFVTWLKKGSSVIVIGELDAGMYNDKNGAPQLDLTVWAESMEFPPLRDNSQTGAAHTPQQPYVQPITNSAQNAAPVSSAPTVERQSAPTPVTAAPVQEEAQDDLPF